LQPARASFKQALRVKAMRHNHLWQIVFSPNGIPDGYRAPR
jgi:hypothetical protein